MLPSTKSSQILLIERNYSLKNALVSYLVDQGWDIHVSNNLKLAKQKILTNRYYLIVFDCSLDKDQDINFLKYIKEHNPAISVLIIGKLNEAHEVIAYTIGANLYHPKPIRFTLLNTQLKSLTYFFKEDIIFELNKISIDISHNMFWVNGHQIDFTRNEFHLILFLTKYEGRTLNREVIITHLLNCNHEVTSSAVDTMVSRIRKKLSPYIDNQFIQTVYRAGYRINPIYFNNYKVKAT